MLSFYFIESIIGTRQVGREGFPTQGKSGEQLSLLQHYGVVNSRTISQR